MIDALRFKQNASRFRKKAKKLGIDRPLCILLDIYAHAHYGRGYARIHYQAARDGVPEPAFPPPFLDHAALQFDVAADLILEAVEPPMPS